MFSLSNLHEFCLTVVFDLALHYSGKLIAKLANEQNSFIEHIAQFLAGDMIINGMVSLPYFKLY